MSPGSPAEAGGLLVGDVIVSLDGEAVDSAEAFVQAVEAHASGDTISVVVTRDGSESTLDIELGTVPANERGGKDDLFASGDLDPQVMAEMVLHVELDTVDNGYQVLAGRMRDQSDLQVGDVITAVNDTPIQDVDWAALVASQTSADSTTLTLTVQRDSAEVTVELPLFAGRGGPDFRGHGGRQGEAPQDGGQLDDGQQPGNGQQSDQQGSSTSTSGSILKSNSVPA